MVLNPLKTFFIQLHHVASSSNIGVVETFFVVDVVGLDVVALSVVVGTVVVVVLSVTVELGEGKVLATVEGKGGSETVELSVVEVV